MKRVKGGVTCEEDKHYKEFKFKRIKSKSHRELLLDWTSRTSTDSHLSEKQVCHVPERPASSFTLICGVDNYKVSSGIHVIIRGINMMHDKLCAICEWDSSVCKPPHLAERHCTYCIFRLTADRVFLNRWGGSCRILWKWQLRKQWELQRVKKKNT